MNEAANGLMLSDPGAQFSIPNPNNRQLQTFRRKLLTQIGESSIFSHSLDEFCGKFEPTASLARRVIRQQKSLMKNGYKTLTFDFTGAAPKPWSACLEQVCQTGITPFVVMDETARTGP
jgi:hypothetical protein